MTEEHHQSPRITNASTLNITDWEAPSSRDMWRESSGDISPRSKVEDDNMREKTLSSADGSTSPSAHKQEDDSNSTTPVPPAKPQFDIVGSNKDWLHEVRKIIREEVSEGIQKLASEAQGQCTGSGATRSVISSSSSSPDNPNLFLVAQGKPSPASTVPQRPGVRFSDRRTFSKRPAGVSRNSSTSHPLTEWGELFDPDGCATSRLRQVLRGLAKHIIDDYTPKNSLVITPEKLHTFYSKYRVEPEQYTFLDMFASNARNFNDCLADFYEDLECQHHLVQKSVHSKARIPALTPAGFANYLATCLLAHPEHEFRRLEQIVSDVALFADTATQGGQPEKLPRSIIRSCLPAKQDMRKKRILDLAVKDLLCDLNVQAPGRRHTPPTSPSSDRRGSSGALTQSSPGRPRHMPPKIHRTAEEPIIDEKYDSRPSGRKRFTPTALQSIGDESLVEAYERTPHGDWIRHYVGEQQDEVGAGTNATTTIGPLRDGGGAKLRDAEEHGPLSAGSSSFHPTHTFLHSNRLSQSSSQSQHQAHDRPNSYIHAGSSEDQQAGTGLTNAESTPGTIPPPPIGLRAPSFSFPAPSSPLSPREGGRHSHTKLRGYSISAPDVAAGMKGAAAALASSPVPSSATAIFHTPSDVPLTITAAHEGAVAAGVYTPASTSSSNGNSEPVSPTTAVLDDRYGGAAADSMPPVHNMLGSGRRDLTDYERYNQHPSPIQSHYRLSSGSISGGGGSGYAGLDGYGGGSHGRVSPAGLVMNMNASNVSHDGPDKHHQHQHQPPSTPPPPSSFSSSSLATIQPWSSGSGGGGSSASDRRSERTSPSRHHQKSQPKSHGGGGSSSSSSSKRRSMPPSLSLAVPRSHAHALSSPADSSGGGGGGGGGGGSIKTMAMMRRPTVTDVPEGADEEVAVADNRGPTWKEYFQGRGWVGTGGGAGHKRGQHGHGHGQKGAAGGYH